MSEPSLPALSGMALEELAELLSPLPRFRAAQIFKWIASGASAFDEMLNLPLPLRQSLSLRCRPRPQAAVTRLSAADGTVKLAAQFADGARIEAVLLAYSSPQEPAQAPAAQGAEMRGAAACGAGAWQRGEGSAVGNGASMRGAAVCGAGAGRRGEGRAVGNGAVMRSAAARGADGQRGARLTACLSTQVGCPAGCVFCKTGSMGFLRNLTSAEIVEQFLLLAAEAACRGAISRGQPPEEPAPEWPAPEGPAPEGPAPEGQAESAARQTQAHEGQAKGAAQGRPISNIVVMGMGEPLLNLEQLRKALAVISDSRGLNFSRRRITISTCGIAEGIADLADNGPAARLALSLTTADEGLRRRLMPFTAARPLSEVKEALRRFQARGGGRITLEATLLGGINTRAQDAKAMAKFAEGLDAAVNLIPWNPVKGLEFEGAPLREPPAAEVEAFSRSLAALGLSATRRFRRGRGVMGACGQLGGTALP